MSAVRTVLAAAVGTAVAVFYPFLPEIWWELFVKAALFAVLSAILFTRTPKPLVSALMFLGCTFALGGACYAVWLAVSSADIRIADRIGSCPMFLAICCGGAVWCGARFCIGRISLLRSRAPYEYTAEVEVFGKTLVFRAFLDTGNCVTDCRTGLPVLITGAELFSKKLDGASAIEFIKSADRFRKIEVMTAAGPTRISVIRPTSVTVYSDKHGHKINAMVGLSASGAFSREREMLIGPAAAEGV